MATYELDRTYLARVTGQHPDDGKRVLRLRGCHPLDDLAVPVGFEADTSPTKRVLATPDPACGAGDLPDADAGRTHLALPVGAEGRMKADFGAGPVEVGPRRVLAVTCLPCTCCCAEDEYPDEVCVTFQLWYRWGNPPFFLYNLAEDVVLTRIPRGTAADNIAFIDGCCNGCDNGDLGFSPDTDPYGGPNFPVPPGYVFWMSNSFAVTFLSFSPDGNPSATTYSACALLACVNISYAGYYYPCKFQMTLVYRATVFPPQPPVVWTSPLGEYFKQCDPFLVKHGLFWSTFGSSPYEIRTVSMECP